MIFGHTLVDALGMLTSTGPGCSAHNPLDTLWKQASSRTASQSSASTSGSGPERHPFMRFSGRYSTAMSEGSTLMRAGFIGCNNVVRSRVQDTQVARTLSFSNAYTYEVCSLGNRPKSVLQSNTCVQSSQSRAERPLELQCHF